MNNNIFKVEPAAATAAVSAVLVLLIAFGVPVSVEQKAAILGVIAPVLALVQGLVTRSLVTPDANVVARAEADGTVVSGPADTSNANGAEVFVESVL